MKNPVSTVSMAAARISMKGQNGEVKQIAIALDRKQLYHQSEQHEVNRGGDEST